PQEPTEEDEDPSADLVEKNNLGKYQQENVDNEAMLDIKVETQENVEEMLEVMAPTQLQLKKVEVKVGLQLWGGRMKKIQTKNSA
ncbi:hypothetical protein GBA52_004141, partial [Prunus armeniaca]